MVLVTCSLYKTWVCVYLFIGVWCDLFVERFAVLVCLGWWCFVNSVVAVHYTFVYLLLLGVFFLCVVGYGLWVVSLWGGHLVFCLCIWLFIVWR